MDKFEVTDIRFHRRREKQSERIIANVSITLNNMMTIHDIKFVRHKDEYIMMLPTKKYDYGYFTLIQIHRDLREYLKDAILK